MDSLVIEDILNFGDQIGPFTAQLDSVNCAPFDVELSAWNVSDQSFDYFWDFNDGNGDPSGNTITNHTYLQPGAYCPALIMTDPNGCSVFINCTDTIVVDEFVIGYTLPEYICEGNSYTIDVSNVELVSWTNNPYLSAGANELQFILAPPVDTDFYLTGIYADCERTDTIHIDVSPLPTVTLEMDTILCFQDSVFQLNQGMPNFPAGTYTLNGNESTSFDPSWTPGEAYLLTYTFTDTLGCTNQATTNLHIRNLPIVVYDAIAPQCQFTGDIAIQTASPLGGTYYHADSVVTSFSSHNPEGEYAFVYDYTDEFGCANSDVQSVTVYPAPIVNIGVPDFCMDDPIFFENNSYVNLGNITSTNWLINNVAYAGYQHDTLEYNDFGTYPLHVVLSTAIGCTTELDTSFTVHPVPQAFFTTGWSCQGDSVLFVDQTNLEQDTLSQWIWTVEGNSYPNDSLFEYAFIGWGDLPVSLTAISSHGCDNTYADETTVHPSPVVELAFENVCDGQEVLFFANESIPSGGIVSQHWDFGDGINSENDSQADHLYTTPAQYTVTYTAVSNIGCTTIITDTVQVFPMPTAAFDADPYELCLGESTFLIDQSMVNYPDEITQWQWFIEDNLISEDQNVTVIHPYIGSFDVSLIATTNNGCSDQQMMPNFITIYPKPTANFSCETELFMYDPIVDIEDNSSPDVAHWNYYFDDGAQANTADCSHEYVEVGNYTIYQYVENTWGCRDTSFEVVNISPDMMIYIPNAFTPDQNGHNEVFKPVTFGFEILQYQFTIFNRWGDVMFTTTDPSQGWDGWYQNQLSQDGLYNWQLDIRNDYDITIHRRTGNVFLIR
jgi:gliding motility-associated-like protein